MDIFFQNTDNNIKNGYIESESILDVGVESALKQIKFDYYKFAKRYS